MRLQGALLAKIKKKVMRSCVSGRESLAEKYSIKDIWIGRHVGERDLRDKKFGGRIALSNESTRPFALVMRFETEEHLSRYYVDAEHSEIRRWLFEELDPRLKVLYDAAESKKVSDRALAYEAIEAIAGKYIQRCDYLEDEAIEQMVHSVDPFDPDAVD